MTGTCGRQINVLYVEMDQSVGLMTIILGKKTGMNYDILLYCIYTHRKLHYTITKLLKHQTNDNWHNGH